MNCRIILGLFLILVLGLGTNVWSEQDLRANPSSELPNSPPPAACHAHGHSSPMPRQMPVHYRCCLTGHDAAVITPPVLLPTLQQHGCGQQSVSTIDAEAIFLSEHQLDSALSIFLSNRNVIASSVLLTPLRI
jgi:hypothetical protein